MKRFRLAVVMGIVSTLCFVSSYYYYQTSRAQSDFHERKYRAIMSARSDRQAYKGKLDAFALRWKSLGELSQEKSADVNYEISMHPRDFGELSEKIVSTYEHGFFFLKEARLESTPEGIRLMVTGFKRGGPAE